jgi:hypothetical protein
MFDINYQVRNGKNLKLEEDVFVKSFADAVDFYQPIHLRLPDALFSTFINLFLHS